MVVSGIHTALLHTIELTQQKDNESNYAYSRKNRWNQYERNGKRIGKYCIFQQNRYNTLQSDLCSFSLCWSNKLVA